MGLEKGELQYVPSTDWAFFADLIDGIVDELGIQVHRPKTIQSCWKAAIAG